MPGVERCRDGAAARTGWMLPEADEEPRRTRGPRYRTPQPEVAANGARAALGGEGKTLAPNALGNDDSSRPTGRGGTGSEETAAYNRGREEGPAASADSTAVRSAQTKRIRGRRINSKRASGRGPPPVETPPRALPARWGDAEESGIHGPLNGKNASVGTSRAAPRPAIEKVREKGARRGRTAARAPARGNGRLHRRKSALAPRRTRSRRRGGEGREGESSCEALESCQGAARSNRPAGRAAAAWAAGRGEKGVGPRGSASASIGSRGRIQSLTTIHQPTVPSIRLWPERVCS